MEKVSIIVPVYHAENYLERSMASLCGQTYENLEIILIDDGSRDNSLRSCKEWEKKDSRIKVYTQENAGVSATRNRGLSLATGTYVMFFDADDWIEANMVEVLYHALIQHHADVACCLLQENQVSDIQNVPQTACVSFEDKVKVGTTQTESGLLFLRVWGPVCKLYRREVLLGMQFEPYEVAEDLLFNTNVVCSGRLKRAVLIEYPFYHYMVYSGSTMKQQFQKKYLTAMEIEAKCYERLTAISMEFADINLIGCSVSRVFEKYAQLSKEDRKKYRADFKACKKFAKQHKRQLLGSTNLHRKLSGALKVYIPDLYLWLLIRRYQK